MLPGSFGAFGAFCFSSLGCGSRMVVFGGAACVGTGGAGGGGAMSTGEPGTGV